MRVQDKQCKCIYIDQNREEREGGTDGGREGGRVCVCICATDPMEQILKKLFILRVILMSHMWGQITLTCTHTHNALLFTIRSKEKIQKFSQLQKNSVNSCTHLY